MSCLVTPLLTVVLLLATALPAFGQLDDQQISSVGTTAAQDAFASDIVYNSVNNEFFIVWHADDVSAGLLDEEFEIFGQRINADTGVPVGATIRISDAGGIGNATYSAVEPSVAYNSIDNEYLVVWHANDLDVANLVLAEFEIFGQRINAATGAEVGINDFRISDAGGTGSAIEHARGADVVYNRTANEYLVVWEADDSDAGLADEDFDIFGQRLQADGTEIGTNDFRISDVAGAGRDAFQVAVSYNSTDNAYLVVWEGDDVDLGLADDEMEILGQRLDAIGNEVGANDFRISDAGGTGDATYRAHRPDVAYNVVDNQYYVVFHADDIDFTGIVDNEFEIYSRRINADGFVHAHTFRVSDSGGDGTPTHPAASARVVYNPFAFEYFVTWDGVDTDSPGIVAGEFEVYGQRIIGDHDREIGINDMRLSHAGGDGDATRLANIPAIALNTTNHKYAVTWTADDPDAGAQDDEFEIFADYIQSYAVPTMAASELSAGSVNLTWSTPDPSITNVRIFRDAIVIENSVPAAGGSYSDTSAPNGVRFNYCVDFLDANDNFFRFACDDGTRFDGGGTDDQRVSGANGYNAAFDALHGAIAYNSTNNEFLIVWQADDPDFGQVDEEFEIIGQRYTALGLPIGNPIRISDAGGTGNADFDAERPSVAYNSATNEYLVVWHADDPDAGLADHEYEIFGQRIHGATGAEVGPNDFLISNVGGVPAVGPNIYDAFLPDVVYNSISNQFLVVWQADDADVGLADDVFEIFGQLLDASGITIGVNDFLISTSGGGVRDAWEPAVAYNSVDNRYLVVWESDDLTYGLADEEYEIFGQRLDANGHAFGADDFRISDAGGTGAPQWNAHRPDVNYNSTDNQYLVAWHADDNDFANVVDNEFEIYSRRINGADGHVHANVHRVTDVGGTGGAFDAAVTYNRNSNEFLIVYSADDPDAGVALGKHEIFGQRMLGAHDRDLGHNDFRLSHTGDSNDNTRTSTIPAVTFNSTNNDYAIIWQSDDADSWQLDDEFEIFFERFFVPATYTITATDQPFTTTIGLTWSGVEFGASVVSIFRDGVFLEQVNTQTGAHVNTYTDVGIAPGMSHVYCLEVFDASNIFLRLICAQGLRWHELTEAPGTVTLPTEELTFNYLEQNGARVGGRKVDAQPSNVAQIPGTVFNRHWGIQRQGTGAFNTHLTFGLPPLSLNETDSEQPERIVLFSRDDANDTWTVRDTAVVVDHTNQTAIFHNIRAFSDFAISRVNLLSTITFTASDDLFENTVQLNWSALPQGAALLRVMRDGQALTVLPIDQRSYDDNTGTAGVIYNYCLQILDTNQAMLEMTCDNGTRRVKPPTTVVATDGTQDDHVLTTWVDRSDINTGFNIYRSTGTSVLLDGVDDGVSLTDFNPTSTFTAEIWARADNTTNGQALLAKQTSSGDDIFVVGFYNGGLEVRLRGHVHRAGILRKGWQHIAVVVEDQANNTSRVTLYRDGIQIWSHVLNAVLGDPTGHAWTVGQRGNGDFFGGHVDEIRFWNVARTLNQLRPTLYTALQGNEANLFALWDFEEGTGTALDDKVGANDGTLSGGTWSYGVLPLGAATNVNASFHQDDTAVSGTTYVYCVAAKDANGVESIRRCDEGFRGFVLPPLTVSATDGQFPDKVVIEWNDQALNETGYQIKRNGVVVGTVNPDIEVFEDNTGLAFGTIYTYCVATMTATNNSVEACDTGGVGILPAVTDVVATDSTFDASVQISWTNPFDANTIYKPVHDASTRGFRVYITHIGGVEQSPPTLLGSLRAGETTFSHTDALAATSYRFCIRTISSISGSTVEAADVCDVGSRMPVLSATDVTATVNGLEDGIQITWETPGAKTVLSKVYRQLAGETTLLHTTAGKIYTDRSAQSDVTYTYCIAPVEAGGSEAPFGTTVIGTCDTGSRRLEPPSSVQATYDENEADVTLTWTDNSEAESGFQILRSTTGVSLDGVNDRVESTALDAVNLTGDFSIALSIKSTVPDGALFTRHECVAGDCANGRFVLFTNVNGHLHWLVEDATHPVESIIYPENVNDGQWHHIVATRKQGDALRLYVDGVLVGKTASISGPIGRLDPDVEPTVLGASELNGNRLHFFTGSMDNAQLWNIALTDEQVQQYQFKTLAGNEAGLVAAWRFEENAGTVVNDQTANNYDASLVEGPTWTTNGAPAIILNTSENREEAIDRTGAPGREYTYGVMTVDAWGHSRVGQAIGRRTILPPTELIAEDGASELTVKLTWVDNSDVETGYHIYRHSGNNPNTLIGTTGPRVGTFVDSPGADLIGEISTYSVFAVDAHGGSTAAVDQGSTALLPPLDVQASEEYTDKVTLKWVDQSGIETAYRIFRNNDFLFDTGANVTTYTDLTGTAGVKYNYCVETIRNAMFTARVCDAGTRLSVPAVASLASQQLSDNVRGEAGETNDFFGYRTAVSRSAIVTGAWRRDDHIVDRGYGYLYLRSENGKLADPIRFTTPNATFESSFARDVDISRDGKYLAVGEPVRHDATAGAITFYEITDDGKLIAGNEISFGVTHGENSAMDDEGRFLAAGITLHDANNIHDVGELRLYKRGANNVWSLASAVPVHGAVMNTRLGLGVSISGDARVVVAGTHDSSGPGNYFSSGRSFVWVNDPDNPALHLRMQLEGSDLVTGDEFGINSSVSEDGEWIFVSANRKAINGQTQAGKVYGYRRNGPVWGRNCFLDSSENNLLTCREDVSFVAPTPTANAKWGALLSVNERRLVIGDQNGNIRTYQLENNAWVEREKISLPRSPNATAADIFNPFGGMLRDETLAIGAYDQAQGAVYFHEMLVPPANVSASDGVDKSKVTISWDDRGQNEENFVVYRDGARLTTVPADIESFADFSAAPGVVYEYCVTSYSSKASINLKETGRQCDLGWRLPTGAISGSITANGGANVEGVSVCLTPSPNNALLFDGQGGYVDMGEQTISSTGSKPFTIEAWVNPGIVLGQGQHMPILSLTDSRDTINHIEFRLLSDGAVNRLELWSLIGGQRVVSNNTALHTGSWYHVVGMYDGSAMQLYINGQLVSSANFTGVAAAEGHLRLGRARHGNSHTYFNGRIDDVRLWNGARSAAQIAEHYQQALVGNEQGLVAYFNADAGQGIGVADRTNSGKDGKRIGGVFWTNQGAPINSCATTDSEGNYTLSNLTIGEEQTVKVTPSKDIREFTPKVKAITLNVNSPIQNEVSFTDISTFSASGRVLFTGTVCPVDSAEVSLNNLFATHTQADGTFSVSVDLGSNTLEVAKGTGSGLHGFTPAVRTFTVAQDVPDLNFTNDTKRVLRGVVQGGCNASVGRAKLRVFTENGCFDQTFDVNGAYSLSLPAQRYLVQVAELEDVPSNLDKGDILKFYNNLGAREVDLTQEADTLDFIYRAPLTLTASGFEPYINQSCNAGLTDVDGRSIPNVPLLRQNEKFPLTLSLVENYGTTQCAVDSAQVLVFDEISDLAEADTVKIDNGVGYYQVDPSSPNIASGRTVEGVDRSYQRSLTLVTDVDGRDPLTQTHWAVTQGIEKRTAEFVTMISNPIPLFVLRDPPGNNSYSYWSKGTSFCFGISQLFSSELSLNLITEKALGPEGEVGIWTGLGAGVVKAESSQSQVLVKREDKRGGSLEVNTNFDFCVESEATYATDQGPTSIGPASDIFIGTGFNFVFALADDLKVNGGSCEISVSETISAGLDSQDPFHTIFAYTRGHIEGQLIPKLKQLTTLNDVDGSETVINAGRGEGAIQGIPLKEQASIWEKMFAEDTRRQSEAEFIENRSFSAGADYEFASLGTDVIAADQTITLYYETKTEVGGSAKVPFFGQIDTAFEFELSLNVGLQTRQESSSTEGFGYVLSDTDFGDFFTVDIFKENLGMSYVFKPRSGVSSNPHEMGYTQPRDKPRLAINPPIQQNLDPDQPASYTISLTNLSESKEAREYHLRPILTTNQGGAILRANGAPLFDHLSFFVNSDQTQEITLEVDRGASRYLHEDLQIQVVPPGEYALWEDGSSIVQADTISFTASFAAPCTPISLFRPVEFWRYTDPNGAPVDIIFDKFSRTWGDNQPVEKLGMQYRRAGTPTWTQGLSVNVADINPSLSTYSATWIPPEEGSYEVRAFSECNNGANRLYSYAVPGKRDTKPAKAFGPPQPADQVLASTEFVNILFDEPIECTSVDTDGLNNNDTVELFYADGNESGSSLANITVLCDDNTLTIEPNGGWGSAHETRLFRARVRNLKDEVDNTMSEPIEWTFRVARSTFAWSPAVQHTTHTFGQNQTVVAELVNGSINATGFSVPSQLTLTRTHDGAGQAIGLPYTVDLPTRDGVGSALSTGTVVAGGKQDVRFTLPDTLSLGTYSGTISATTTLGAVPLHFSTEVVCRAPTWSVDPSQFQYSMTMTAQLFIREGENYLASQDAGDLIGAFVDDELRGVAHVQNLGANLFRASLIVYSNIGSGERVTFRVYDSSSCNLFAETSKVFVFQSDVNHGNPTSPIAVHAPAPPAQNIAVAAGWTWLSTNKVPTATDVTNVLKTLGGVAGTAGDIIKSQSAFSLYDGGSENWIGTLTDIQPGLGYQLRVAQSGELQLQGSDADLSTTINLQQGWNWIGYVPQAAQPINDALAGLATVRANDLIKSQFAFAQYVSGVGWLGSLTQLEPGYGYLMRVGSAGSFTYPLPPAEAEAVPLARSVTEAHLLANVAVMSERDAASSAATGTTALKPAKAARHAEHAYGGEEPNSGKAIGRVKAREGDALEEAAVSRAEMRAGWLFNPRQYSTSMVVMAGVAVEEMALHATSVLVGAFVGKELRGVAPMQYVEALDDYRAFVLVYGHGEGEEEVSFRLLDRVSEEEIELRNTLAFEADGVVGSVEEAVELRTKEGIGRDEVPDTFVLEGNYPNPFNPETVIRYALPEASSVEIVVYDLLGREVVVLHKAEVQQAGRYEVVFDARGLASGMYVYRMKAGSFVSAKRMVLLK